MLKSRFYLGGFASLFLLTTFLPTSCIPDVLAGSSTKEVVGKVVLDGQPVENANIVFVPLKPFDKSGRKQNFSYATTDAGGNFILEQANGDLGAVTGRHRVIISKRMTRAHTAGTILAGILADLQSSSGKSQFQQLPGELFPIIYNRQSTLTFNVDAAENKVEANFNLSSIDPLIHGD